MQGFNSLAKELALSRYRTMNLNRGSICKRGVYERIPIEVRTRVAKVDGTSVLYDSMS